jgi:PIN like domain
MRFLVDNNLPPRLAKALSALDGDHMIQHLGDRFPRDTTDLTWLKELASERDWAIITADRPKGEHEQRAWADARLKVFFLAPAWRHQALWEKAWRLIKWWPVIVATATNIRGHQAYEVPIKGASLRQLS